MLPQEFTERMQGMLQEEYPSFLRCFTQEREPSLRLNPLKANREVFLEKSPFTLSEVAWEENGFYYSREDTPGKHAWHEAGVYYIQEASAMAPAVYLDAKPSERILDLCAAPGGKSTQIAAAMRGEGILVCNEIHPARAKVLSGNVERMGVANALVTNETPKRLAERFFAYFDRILVDAPCSGEGMFRKNEEACKEWSLENVRMCAARQDAILDCAARMLAPGGRLVYSTCTFAPEEDEGSVLRFLHRHPDFCVEKLPRREGMDKGHPEWAAAEPAADGLEDTIRLWPHKSRGEGHFLVVLKKEGSLAGSGGLPGGCRVDKKITQKEWEAWEQFAGENLRTDLEGVFLKFGEQLYLTPELMPDLQGIKVLRPGLHLGTWKKDRFVPAHALALSLDERKVRRVHELGENACREWMEGMALRAEGEKGWYLMTIDGYSLGWGKLAGGVMKNHYPKGLRKKMP